MAFIFKLVTICIVATLASAQLNYNNPVFIPEYIQTQSSYVEALQQPPTPNDGTPEISNFNIQQLPNSDAPKPFLTAEPATVLKAPTEEAFITNFNTQPYAVPATELQLPSLINWNPNDDPNLYYPVILEKTAPINVPTVLYPKKYNKSSLKVKPSAFKTKESVSSDDLVARQKQIEKQMHAFAKIENKKQLELEKLVEIDSSDQVRKVNDTLPAASGFHSGFSSSHSLSPQLRSSSSVSSSGGGFTHDALGLGNQNGDRMQFHIHGHDGPKSYKWGFDTGKGHNRQIRFEERDKHGIVKGHYGYHDKHGKLRLVHYDSHPHEGFHASEEDFGSN